MRKLFILFLTSFFLVNCNEPVTEIKENIFSAMDNCLVENEFNSTIEAFIDWTSDDVFYKKAERILPQNIKVTFIDSTFSDLNGVEGLIDFGLKGYKKPYGLLCSDNKYRAGKVRFKLNQPIEIPGAVLSLTFIEADSFYTGAGNEMYRVEGQMLVENPDGMSIVLKTNGLKVIHEKTVMHWSCNRSIKLLKDAGKGIWGDVYSLDGFASGTNRNGEMYEVKITEPLIKKMEEGCSETFVQGRLEVINTQNEKSIKVNYDPEGTQKCDKRAEAEINGKKTIFMLGVF